MIALEPVASGELFGKFLAVLCRRGFRDRRSVKSQPSKSFGPYSEKVDSAGGCFVLYGNVTRNYGIDSRCDARVAVPSLGVPGRLMWQARRSINMAARTTEEDDRAVSFCPFRSGRCLHLVTASFVLD